ncbi:hypothetical protein TNCV_4321051 [Trichonephila clavipes]|nr:hypothetical protein TNCV_4321051 [Trichonephila clavipes]
MRHCIIKILKRALAFRTVPAIHVQGMTTRREAVSKNIPLEFAFKLRPLKGYALKISCMRNYSFSEKGLDGVLKEVRRWGMTYPAREVPG